MNLFLSICPICKKVKGGINPVNHERCSRKLQQMNLNVKRRVAPTTLGVKRGDSLAKLILKST